MNLNVTLIAQAITFFVFIFFCAKFVWPPLVQAIEDRQKMIAGGLAAAEEGKKSLEVSAQQSELSIATARNRAQEIVVQAESRVAQMIEEAKVAAKQEGEREKAAAKAEIEQELARAKESLRSQVASLVITGAEQILRREVDAKAHADILNSLQQQL